MLSRVIIGLCAVECFTGTAVITEKNASFNLFIARSEDNAKLVSQPVLTRHIGDPILRPPPNAVLIKPQWSSNQPFQPLNFTN